MNKKYLKDLGILLGIVIVASIGARVLAGGETLDQYAEKNGHSSENSSIAATYASTEVHQASDESSSAESSSVADTSSASDTSSSESSISSTASTAEASADNSVADSASSERVTLREGFYYEPISNEVFRRISGISYPVDCTVALDDLRYVGLMYVDFNGDSQKGEMICNKNIAQDIVEIFSELYSSGYQIESIKLIDEFGGDDTASMEANNTSCFNYRVVDGTTRLSNHAYGLAIDLNPYYNPYITYNNDGTTNCSPEGSRAYEDRSAAFPYKIDENDLAYKLFKEHGFKWGGNWNSVKDYQHFERP